MPKVPGEPLRKVTLNLFESDVAWFQQRHGQGYSEVIRAVVRNHVSRSNVVERTLSHNRDDWKGIFGPYEEDPNAK